MVITRQRRSSNNVVVKKRTVARTEKEVVTNLPPRKQNPRRKTINSVVAAMSLEEMLDASTAVNACFRGVEIPTLESDNVKIYVNHVAGLRKNPKTRESAENLLNKLNEQIVKKNIESNKITTDKARRLYSELKRGK